MRRIALFVVVASTMAWATTVMVTGCSSDPAVKNTPDASKKISSSSSSGDDNTSSSSGNSSSGNSTSGSTTSSSGSTKDAGTDASTSSGGALGSNALKITCGAASCDTDGDGNGACCWPGGDQSKAKCAAAGGQCDPDNDFNIACDEKADCKTAGEVCCWGNGQTQCDGDCNNVDRPDGQPVIQVCKTDAECVPAGTKCAVKTCTIDPNGLNLKAKMSVCGTPTGCQ